MDIFWNYQQAWNNSWGAAADCSCSSVVLGLSSPIHLNKACLKGLQNSAYKEAKGELSVAQLGLFSTIQPNCPSWVCRISCPAKLLFFSVCGFVTAFPPLFSIFVCFFESIGTRENQVFFASIGIQFFSGFPIEGGGRGGCPIDMNWKIPRKKIAHQGCDHTLLIIFTV